MNKSVKTLVISLLLIIALPMAKVSAQVSTWDGTWQPWTHGTGTEADPFLIENAQQLAYLAYRVNNGLDAGGGHVSNHDYHYKLMVDVNLNGSEVFQWTPIGYGNSDSDYQCFGGYFDGNNHTISGLYINRSANSVGFFGYADGATIGKLGIISNTIATTNSYAGGIIGYSKGTTIHNCHHIGNVMSGGSSGGIIGYSEGTTISNSYNSGNVKSNSYESDCGGIIGCVKSVTSISNCYNNGNVTSDMDSGGIVGENYGQLNINNCYNTGSVKSHYNGGIVGYNRGGSLFITNCYNTGLMVNETGTSICGGIIGGGSTGGSNNNNYYLSTCGGNNTYGGEPKTDVYMKSLEFVNVLNSGTCLWEQDTQPFQNSGYPTLTMISVLVSSSNATNATPTHATLHGTIKVENTSVQSQGFEYKKSSDYRFQTINVPGNGSISTTLLGLVPNEQYVFRVFCNIADCGTYYGEEKSFNTLPVNITTNYATDVTANSAILHGYIDIGDATLVCKGFEYRAVGVTDFTTVNVAGNENDFNTQITGLQLNTTYEFRAFMNIAESPITYYGTTRTFEMTWLNQDTIYISDASMLRWVSEQCNSATTFEGKCIKLMNDISLPLNVPNNMTTIGSYPNHPFKGTFDGNGKLIYNLYIDQPNTPYQGFFGYTLNANLYNVGLVNITASGRNYTGGMVAYAKNTYMRDCYVNGGTLFALSYCGGLVGYQEQGTNSIISGCYNTCEVTGNNYVGGLIGFSNYSTVRNSYVAGRVSAQGEPVGAIIGGANEVLMYYCYFSTELTGQTEAIGWNNIGKAGGEGLTNAQMRDPQFVNTLNQNLVTPVWMADYTTHINNGFPIIKWQRPGTGVEEHDAAKSCISLYPNPANDFVTIQSDDSNVSLQHVEVYDVMGRKVMSEVLDGQSKEFSIDKLHAGVYYVRIQTSNGCCTNLKLIVQ